MALPGSSNGGKEPNGLARHFRQNAVAYAMALAVATYAEWRSDDRFTGRQAEKLEVRIQLAEEKLATLPPAKLLERVTRLEEAVEYLRRDIDRTNGWRERVSP